ncbi:MAG TPA: M56 family metallopeptidase [Blastocatellia bacterium]|nr:M56 family metallopeptidase [Blastocatellia bacterium]
MISTINEAAVALSSWVELSILGKATIMLVIGLTVAKLAVRARASVRHILLVATFATVFALPVIVFAAPKVMIGVQVSREREPIAATAAVASPDNLTSSPRASVASRVTEGNASSGVSSLSWIAIFRLVWIAGATLLLGQLGIDLWRLRRIRRDGLPWSGQRELIQSLAAESGIRRPVEILLHEDILAPLTFGMLRPTILLPDEASEWSEADLRRAVVHELEHVRRGDWVIQLAARATCMFYWFHPLAWLAFRSLSLEAERACDDAVVRSAERTEYAEQLVLLAGRLSRANAQPALGMANRSDLSTRVTALLDGSQRRGRPGLLMAASALSVASLVVAAIGPVRAVTLPQKQDVRSAHESGAEKKTTKKRLASAIDRGLLEAAGDGDISGIGELLAAGANVNCRIGGDGSPLIAAARGGHLAAVRFLLDRGADPNLDVQGDGNPLIAAAAGGFADVVSLLLDRGANIDQIVKGDENALIQASANGHLDVVKLLVTRGADVNARAWAATEVTVELVHGKVKELTDTIKLVEAMTVADQDKTKGEWRTPLGMAIKGGHKDVVSFLIAAGAREQ